MKASPWALLFCLAIALPYALIAGLPGPRVYSWQHGLDQHVYLSWVRQAQDGHFFLHNLFTTRTDSGALFNLATWVTGLVSRATGLPGVLALHGLRLGSAVLFVLVLCRWLQRLGGTPLQRQFAALCVLFGSGLGWLIPSAPDTGPVDRWQTEAITFLAFYNNPLMAVGLALLLLSFYAALRARNPLQRGLAGLLVALLANVHSYDALHFYAVWLTYQAWNSYRQRSPGPLLQQWPVLVPGALSMAYQVWVMRMDPVFLARANVPTLSASPWFVLLGLGAPALLLPFVARTRPGTVSPGDWNFLWVWALVGVALGYLPLSFQRKLIMGCHIPICILFGYGWVNLCRQRRSLLGLTFLLLLPSNLLWLARDWHNAVRQHPLPAETQAHQHGEQLDPYDNERLHLLQDEADLLRWIDRNLPPNAAILAPPCFSVLVPGRSGRRVFCGHWGETPDFMATAQSTLAFYALPWSNEQREQFLRDSGVSVVVTYSGEYWWGSARLQDFRSQTPACLHLLYQNRGMSLFRVVFSETRPVVERGE